MIDYRLHSVTGYRETAFAYAILAAGVAHNVARACSMGRLLSCSCDPSSYTDKTPTNTRDVQWKWGGCSHNLEYGMDFSRQFLDAREKGGDIQSTVNLHNNQAGRLVSATFATSTSLNPRCEHVHINQDIEKDKILSTFSFYDLDFFHLMMLHTLICIREKSMT